MRSIIIPNLAYKDFEAIRNTLYKSLSYAIISNTYCNGTGYLQFWDESFIPDILKPFIVSPVNAKLLSTVNHDLADLNLDVLNKKV